MCLTTACSIFFVKHKLYDYTEGKSLSHAASPTDDVPSAVKHDDHNAVTWLVRVDWNADTP